jgi:hemolysin III
VPDGTRTPGILRRLPAVLRDLPLPISVGREQIPVTSNPLIGKKPRHRGKLHRIALFVSIPAGIAMCAIAPQNWSARIAAIIYCLSVSGLFASSALYNILLGTDRLRSWMRWLDHCMIYVLIAGSYTPVSWLLLPKSVSKPLLAGVWLAAVVGIVLKLTSLRKFRRVAGTLYVVMGWACLLVLPKLFDAMTNTHASLLIVGGAFFMVGAIFLWIQRPNPTPDFGYHEVWHAFVVAGTACHFLMTWLVLLGPTVA